MWRELFRPVGIWGMLALGAVFGLIITQAAPIVPYDTPLGSWVSWINEDRCWRWLALGFIIAETLSRLVGKSRAAMPTSRAFRVCVRSIVVFGIAAPILELTFLVHIAILAILNARMGLHAEATLADSIRCFLG